MPKPKFTENPNRHVPITAANLIHDIHNYVSHIQTVLTQNRHQRSLETAENRVETLKPIVEEITRDPAWKDLYGLNTTARDVLTTHFAIDEDSGPTSFVAQMNQLIDFAKARDAAVEVATTDTINALIELKGTLGFLWNVIMETLPEEDKSSVKGSKTKGLIH